MCSAVGHIYNIFYKQIFLEKQTLWQMSHIYLAANTNSSAKSYSAFLRMSWTILLKGAEHWQPFRGLFGSVCPVFFSGKEHTTKSADANSRRSCLGCCSAPRAVNVTILQQSASITAVQTPWDLHNTCLLVQEWCMFVAFFKKKKIFCTLLVRKNWILVSAWLWLLEKCNKTINKNS